MNATSLFSAPFFAALSWALFHFLWQGAVVAAALAALGMALRKSAPSVRYAVACGALATMLALPIVTAWSASGDGLEQRPAAADAATVEAAGEIRGADATTATVAADGLIPVAWRARIEVFRPWVLSAWFAGVLLLSIRFLGGLNAALQLTRRGAGTAPPEWQHTVGLIAARLSVTRPVRLLESAIVQVPTAIGAFRPAILLPASVFTGLPVRGLEALIAHELAHVRRHDYLVNLLQTVVETLLFYHPAVWWVSARVRAEREQCCDDLAIAATGDARTYARALVRLEEMRGRAPALAVAAAGGNLWNRIVRVLKETREAAGREGEGVASSRRAAGAVALGMLFVIGAAAQFGPANGDGWDPADRAEEISLETPEPDAVVSPPATETAESDAWAADDEEPESDSNSDSETDATDPEEQESEPEEAGTRSLTPDELVAFRIHGVTAEFVKSIAALGYDRADPDDILALRIHGVTPSDIAEMNRLFGRQSLDDHTAFKIHGLDAETVRRLSGLGLGKLSADDALAMRIHGVDARFVEGLRAAGFDHLSADDVVAARIHGVSAADAAAWTKVGFARPSLEDLTSARIHGVTADFVSQMRSLGFPQISLEDATAFRIHGVTPEFVREMRSLGLSSLSGEDAVAFRIHDVGADFVRDIRAAGYADASADELVGLRVHGISADDIRRRNAQAGRRVPLEEILDEYENDYERDDDDED
jgi:beta-lactamase regulating signal transducer with metallopeptidase domain